MASTPEPQCPAYGWMYVQKITPFYRTLSPIGAAALPAPMKTKEKVERGKGTADHLMPLGYLLYISSIYILTSPSYTYP